jgi:hypothetical protein
VVSEEKGKSKSENVVVLGLEQAENRNARLGKCDGKKKEKGVLRSCAGGKEKEKSGGRYTYASEGYGAKKKKNLEQCKGNSFACLDVFYLSENASDVHARIGADDCENASIVTSLIDEEKGKYDKFVEQNPEILLPVDLDLDIVTCCEPQAQQLESNEQTPPISTKDQESAPLWTEVVRRKK